MKDLDLVQSQRIRRDTRDVTRIYVQKDTDVYSERDIQRNRNSKEADIQATYRCTQRDVLINTDIKDTEIQKAYRHIKRNKDIKEKDIQATCRGIQRKDKQE